MELAPLGSFADAFIAEHCKLLAAQHRFAEEARADFWEQPAARRGCSAMQPPAPCARVPRPA
jgi:hypothetical protein